MKRGKISAAAKEEQLWGYLMVAPTIIGLLILNVWPFIQTIYASFCEHLGFGHYSFIGGIHINLSRADQKCLVCLQVIFMNFTGGGV